VAAEKLKLTILSPERRLLNRVEVHSVTLPGSEGQIQILAGHAAMVETGIFSYIKTSGDGEVGVVSTGFFELRDDDLTVMAETIELRTEIDVERARSAQRKAEAVLVEAALDEHKFGKYQLKLQRAIIRQQVVAK
jgi:F-type H+-transporting ATPase subunit epsilon